MSKSFRKLLIVGGDSWSDPNDPCYKEFNVKKIWPEMVADFLDYDIINVSKGGAGNNYIHGQVIDAIEANPNRNIVVMVNWSQATRMVPYDMPLAQLTFNPHMPDLDPPYGAAKNECQKTLRHLFQLHVYNRDLYLMEEEEFWLKVANVSLRDIYLLDQYCKTRDIPLLHHRALLTLSGVEWILKPEINFKLRNYILEVCKQNQYYQKILKFKNIVGHPNFFEKGSSCFDLYHKYFLSPDEKHPNESGHQLIAHSFINKYIELYEERSLTEPSYVYD
jgi:hypothetical protein